MRDFSLEMYRGLCEALNRAGYECLTVAGYLQSADHPSRVAILRHDVDRRPGHALKMAELERSLGLRATYYVRHVRGVFSPQLVQALASQGHEVGYHYETLAKTKGDTDRALTLFGAELADLRRYVSISTCAMHGSPLSPYDNRSLWRSANWQQFGLLGEAYLSLDYSQVAYLTDTGRSWNDHRANLRDKVREPQRLPPVKSTLDLIDLIGRGYFGHVCISTHPERWPSHFGGWVVSAAVDLAANQVKRAIRMARRTQGQTIVGQAMPIRTGACTV